MNQRSKTQVNLIQKPTNDVRQVATIVERFRNTGANVLTTASFVEEIPTDHRLVVRVIEFDRRDFFSTGSGRYALSKRALEQLASACGIIWRVDLTGRMDSRAHPNYVEFRAAAAAPDAQTGTPRLYSATCAMDLRDGSAATEEILQKRNGKRQLQQKRRFIVALADTGARLRVIRQVIPVRSDYTENEIARPFVTVAMIYQPGVDDEGTRQQMVREAFRARQSMYYGAAAAGVGNPIPQVQRVESFDPQDVDVFGGRLEEEVEEPPHYFDVDGSVRDIEFDASIYAALDRRTRNELATEAMRRADYNLAAVFESHGKRPRPVEDLTDPALLRLYCACLDRIAPTHTDDDIPF